MTYKISDLARAVAKIESLGPEEAKPREKALRNMTQRLPFKPAGRDGHADVFDDAGIAALRLVQIAAGIGVGRPGLDALTRQLTSSDHLAPRVEKSTMPTVAADMVRRARDGENFCLRIDRTQTGDVLYNFGHIVSGKINQIFENAGANPTVVASLEIQAGELIRDLLTELRA